MGEFAKDMFTEDAPHLARWAVKGKILRPQTIAQHRRRLVNYLLPRDVLSGEALTALFPYDEKELIEIWRRAEDMRKEQEAEGPQGPEAHTVLLYTAPFLYFNIQFYCPPFYDNRIGENDKSV